MPFWKKKKAKEELKEFKEKIKGKEKPPKPEKVKGKKPEAKIAPLFVKIDRYKHVLKQLDSIRTTLRSFKDMLDLVDKVDKLKSGASKRLGLIIEELTKSLIALDEEFIRPEGIKPEELARRPEAEVKGYMRDLRSELESLRKDLESLK